MSLPARDGGQLRSSGGRGQKRAGGWGGPRALTSSAIFQTFDPFRKARCSPAAAASSEQAPGSGQPLEQCPLPKKARAVPGGPVGFHSWG